MRLGDDVIFFLREGANPKPAKVVRLWSEHQANVLVFLDGMNDADDFGGREIVSCTAHRTSIPLVAAGEAPKIPTLPFIRELADGLAR